MKLTRVVLFATWMFVLALAIPSCLSYPVNVYHFEEGEWKLVGIQQVPEDTYTQKTFTLDLDNPVFEYEETALNDSNYTKDLVFSNSENKTVGIRLPKNSTILYSQINVTGVMKPVQSSTIGNMQVRDLEVANVNLTSEFDEIIVGTMGPATLQLLNNSGGELWKRDMLNDVSAVSVGNLSSDIGKDVVASDGTYVCLLNSSGNYKWSQCKDMGSDINDLEVANVNLTSEFDEIVVVAGNNVYLLNVSGQELHNYDAGASCNGVGIGNLSSDEGSEIGAGCGSSVYILNSSLEIKDSLNLGNSIKDVDVSDVDPTKEYDEIAVGLSNGTIILLDYNLNVQWSYTPSTYAINTIEIGEVTTEYGGNEIVTGSNDDNVYVLNTSGGLVWNYKTQNDVKGIGIGNLTTDPGNEVATGTIVPADTNIYILNFEYYPENPSLDVGVDGSYDWIHTGKLRTNTVVPNVDITPAIQNYLNNICTSQICNVPLVFHSDFAGNLRITFINITYNYNASEAISYTTATAWSRTYNILVNESVANEVINISYSTPANKIEIRYVRVNDTATLCDFGGERYSNITIEGINYCDISSNPKSVSPGFDYLWDNEMNTGIPVRGSETSPVIDTVKGTWSKNYTIWNTTTTIFYNVTANTTIGDEVRSNEGLFVEWNDQWYDITPSIDCPDYELVSQNFYVCKSDTDGDNVAEIFRWKQPQTSTVNYIVNGSINSPALLLAEDVIPPSGIWGSEFNYTVNVSDRDGDNVSVTLWVYIDHLNAWEKRESKNTTIDTSLSNETLVFPVITNKSWVGMNKYKFEYFDFNGTTGGTYHSAQNTTNSTGPDVTKHDVSITLIEGNNTNVTRSGSDSTTFTVVVTDIDSNPLVNVSGVNCSFWVTKDTINFDLANSTETNSSGFCNFIFDPDDTYTAGQQSWKAGVYQDAYYNDKNSTNFVVNIYGGLGINLTIIGQNFTRGVDSTLEAKLVDENLNDVAEPGYNCAWYINTTQIGISTTNDTGYCKNTWITNCSSYPDLGSYLINVTLSDGGSGYYTTTNNESSTYAILKGTLNVTIILPVDDSVVYERQTVNLNSTVTDECMTQDNYSHDISWYSLYPYTHSYLCPNPPRAVGQGINTTWTFDDTCTPRYPQIIIANATGDLYNSNEKNVSIYIFGFADVEVTTPVDGSDVWRNESSGIVDVVCKVTSNASGWGQNNYPVNFWERYGAGSFNPLNDIGSGTNIANTNISGYAKVEWNISSNSTVPEGNHTIKCNISDNPALYFNTSVAEDNITVTVKGPEDWLPPVFLRVTANSVEQYKENVTIEADVYDIWGVDKVWVIITHPDGTNSTHSMTNISSLNWSYTENFTDLGDYDFTVFANDTSGNKNQTSSWFEVYPGTVLFYGNTTDAKGNNVSVEFTFYRNGTDWIVHTNKTTLTNGEYNFTVRKRMYDIDVRVFNQTIKFLNVNMSNDTKNAVYNFDFIPQDEIPLMYGPRNVFVGFAFETILDSSYINLTLNYTGFDRYLERFDPGKIHVFKCSDWNYSLGDCSTGPESWVSLGGIPSYSDRIVSVLMSGSSCFVAGDEVDPNDGVCDLGERCAPGLPWHDITCCGATPGGPSGGGPSGGGGVSPTRTTTLPSIWLFSLRTNLTEPQLNPGTEEVYALWITNNVNRQINVSISATGSIAKFISFEKESVQIDARKEEIDKIYVVVPTDAEPGTYTGHINVVGDGRTETLPVSLTVSIKGAAYLDVLVESRNKRVGINETARFRVMLYNYGLWKRLNLNLTYLIEDPETQEVFYQENEEFEITQSKILDKRIPLSGLNISVGRYLFNVTVQYDGKVASAYDDFEMTESFWTTDRINQALIVIVAVTVPLTLYFVRKRYIAWKLAKARYIFPIDFRKLPKGRIWLGKIAETNRKAYFKMNELRTHVLTAGATGSGKSVSAMIFVEELLREKIPVVVFDPTAQWSGFVRPCKDPNLLKFYKEFGMDKRDVRPYNGMIYEVTDPNVKIDFDKYMNPGEITVFMLNKLKPGQYDDAVRNIIDTIFAHGWEESTKLKMVVVFDEVHRLLEKYGGKGGYVALERACREFRKWGIGLIMASQVLSDFKEAIKGNVLTEIQLHTKSLGDLGRVEKKYGLDYTKRVTKLEVGVGMMQNPRYNKGRPWFIAFRPTWHEPHKIPDRDLETYKEYAAILAKIEAKIESMEKAGKDVFDLRTEFKLAQDKLKKGRFRMAKIYIDSLKKHLLEG